MNTSYAGYLQGFCLPEKADKCQLTALIKTVYALCAVAKSTAGIRTPFNHKAHRRQYFDVTGFFMRTICARPIFVSACVRLPLNYGGLVEAAKAGRFLSDGKANLDQSTTHKISLFGGGFNIHTKEAVTMTTTPTQAVTTAMIYTFLIAGGVRTLSTFKRIRTISVVAQSELLAREQLTGLPLVFMSRTPNRTMGVAL